MGETEGDRRVAGGDGRVGGSGSEWREGGSVAVRRAADSDSAMWGLSSGGKVRAFVTQSSFRSTISAAQVGPCPMNRWIGYDRSALACWLACPPNWGTPSTTPTCDPHRTTPTSNSPRRGSVWLWWRSTAARPRVVELSKPAHPMRPPSPPLPPSPPPRLPPPQQSSPCRLSLSPSLLSRPSFPPFFALSLLCLRVCPLFDCSLPPLLPVTCSGGAAIGGRGVCVCEAWGGGHLGCILLLSGGRSNGRWERMACTTSNARGAGMGRRPRGGREGT